MKNTLDRSAIDKLHSIETAERYLIARTHAELDRAAGKRTAKAFGQPIFKSALAIGVTATVVWVLQIGIVRDLLTATV
jgi:hypothetical protein